MTIAIGTRLLRDGVEHEVVGAQGSRRWVVRPVLFGGVAEAFTGREIAEEFDDVDPAFVSDPVQADEAEALVTMGERHLRQHAGRSPWSALAEAHAEATEEAQRSLFDAGA